MLGIFIVGILVGFLLGMGVMLLYWQSCINNRGEQN